MVECEQRMIKGKDISNYFWAEAISIVIYLMNIGPTGYLDLKTPFIVIYLMNISPIRYLDLKTQFIVIYLMNISPKIYLDIKTPFESLYGFKTVAHHLTIFGCKAFAHIMKDNINKLDFKGIKCISVGYYLQFKSCKMFDPSDHNVFASRDIIFHEHAD